MKYRTQKALQTKDARSAYAIPTAKAGVPYKDTWDLDRVMREAMGKVIPIFRGVHTIADNQARLPVEVRQGSESGAAIEDHPLVRILNQRPNPDETPYVFRYRLSSQVVLSRKGAFIEVVRDRIGEITALYLLDPRKTNPVPSKTVAVEAQGNAANARLVDHFQVDLGQGKVDKLDPERVIWVRLPHPVDPLMGMTPLEAAGLTIDIDVLAKLYNRTFLHNDGRPGGIVGVKGDMEDDVADELDDRFNNTRGAGRISIIEADGLDWVDTAVSPRDAQYVEALAMTKVDLLGALGVPESIAYGNASGRTFDNAAAEWAFFWQSVEMGHLALLGDGLNQADEDDETYVAFDLSGVDVVQRNERTRREEMRAEVVAGVRTLDSYLEETGETPLGSPEAKSYWRAMGDVPYATEGDEAPVLTLVQDVAQEAAKAAVEALEGKGRVVRPFRYAPRSGGTG